MHDLAVVARQFQLDQLKVDLRVSTCASSYQLMRTSGWYMVCIGPAFEKRLPGQMIASNGIPL